MTMAEPDADMARSGASLFDLSDGVQRLKETSPITFAIERLFWVLQIICPGNLLFGTRVGTQRREDQTLDTVGRLARWRSRGIEFLVWLWLVFELELAVGMTLTDRHAVRLIAEIGATWRIADILVVAVNLNVFDRLRRGSTATHRVASLTRTVVLSFVNYLELFILFGLIYACHTDLLARPQVTAFDPYYFSVATQLTIGYGDISPLGGLREIAAAQAIVGFLFGLIVLARLVAFLPRTFAVIEDD